MSDPQYFQASSKLLVELARSIQLLDHKLVEKEGYSHKDARIVALRNLDANVSSVIMVHMMWAAVERGVLDLGPIQAAMALDTEAVPLAVRRLEYLLRVGLVVLYQFEIEGLLKNLLVALHKSAPSGFYKVVESLLDAITVKSKKKKLKTLNALALIRNSLHNTGIHKPPSKKSAQVTIDGVTYKFRYGKRVTCAGWAQLIPIMRAGLKVLEDICLSPQILALPHPIRNEYVAQVDPY